MSELPKGWVETKISEVTEYVQRGKGPKYTDVKSFPVVNQKAIRWFGLQEEHLKYVREDMWDKYTEERFIRSGDILWNSTGTGTIGRACLLDDKEAAKAKVVDSHVTIVRSNKSIDPRYLFNWIKSPKIQFDIESLSTGTTNQVELSKAKVLDTIIPLAPLNEQIRIADKLDSILTKVDTAQTRLDKIPNILKCFRQSVLIAATSGELTEEWRDENQVTFNWDERKVSDIVRKIEAGKSIKCDERPPRGDEYGIIKISAVTWGKYNEEESKTLKDKSIFLENRRVQLGDFLISRANTLELLGMPVIVHEVTKNLMLSDKVLRLVMDEVDKQWLNYYFRSPLGRTQIQNGSSGNQESMRNIGQKALMAITLNNPPLDEKKEIIRRVESLFTIADTVEKQYTDAKVRTNRLTQSILAKAFRGELVPQHANDEPAELLLQKIQVTQQMTPKVNKRKTPVPIKTVVSNTLNIENVKKWIDKTEGETFTSEDIFKFFSSSYEELKQVIFLLLKEKKPSVEQVFDSKAKDFVFRKVK